MLRSRTAAISSACAIALIGYVCLGCGTSRPTASLNVTRLFRDAIPSPPASVGRPASSDQETLDAIAGSSSHESLEIAAAHARLAEKAQSKSDPECVSLYAKAALESWPELLRTHETPNSSDNVAATAWDLYHHSLAQLIRNAAKHGQLDPRKGIFPVTSEGETGLIQITHHGFPWRREDFNELHVVQEADPAKLARYWSEPGLGVPLVVVRRRSESEEFLGKAIPFAATAILRPSRQAGENSGSGGNGGHPAGPPVVGVLELYDPLRVTQITSSTAAWNLARDTSAPLAMAQKVLDRDNLQNFLRPGRVDEDGGLRMIEPYQPGKIPVVFVHGLLSDKATWIDLVNDLRAVPWFSHRYQIWAFQYPTGQPFVRSAAQMRQSLYDIRQYCDPQGTDAALSHLVLVGHSMGGLVAKLQVSSSRSALWDSIASRPLEEIQTTAENRAVIQSLFFFEPVPSVKRVVFIGSPHQGSRLAQSWLGKLGAILVKSPKERTQTLQTLLKSNPDVFIQELAKRIPTSVDLLRPDNPLLLATYSLPVAPAVRLHTIIGTGRELKDGTPADGVVPVESARHPGTVSERHIDTVHTKLPDHPETTEELVRILSEHLREFYAGNQKALNL